MEIPDGRESLSSEINNDGSFGSCKNLNMEMRVKIDNKNKYWTFRGWEVQIEN